MKAPVGVGGLRAFGGAARLPFFMFVAIGGGTGLEGFEPSTRGVWSLEGLLEWLGGPRAAPPGGPRSDFVGLFLLSVRGGGTFLCAFVLLPVFCMLSLLSRLIPDL